ncbi:MAG: shikimate dehydrogenase family protein, partial [Pyrinomonadaceae bacterium]
GYNTDAAAFIETLAERVGELRNLRCAVIGSGGVASAAVWSLKQKQTDVTVFARDTEKARVLAEKFGVAWKALDDAAIEGFDVVINATPLGTSGERENQTPAKAPQLAGTRLAYDLVYNPVETRFLREARKAGCDVLSGLDMLVTQAAEQFRLWSGDEAPVQAMRKAAIRALKV